MRFIRQFPKDHVIHKIEEIGDIHLSLKTYNLDSSRATLMSDLGWNSLSAISNDFPDSLKRSCDIAEPEHMNSVQLLTILLSAFGTNKNG